MYKCFLVSMRSQDKSPPSFKADSRDHALEIAKQKVGLDEWDLRFDREMHGGEALAGLAYTYISDRWCLYIHDERHATTA
ncbi:MAG: hypothetical protein OXN25_03930 [Candidatus Poribacteria bacterium]|nr:hypothetical protein [Candidatus Poribacteria bacterium]